MRISEKGNAEKLLPVSVSEMGDRRVLFTISVEEVDRDGDIVVSEGADFTNYLKNMVFLGFHNSRDFPLGVCEKIWKEPKQIKAVVYFPTLEELSSNPEQASEKAKLVDFCYHCYKTGMLNAVSVGFLPIDYEPIKETGGVKVNKWEMLEFSAVAVPANQDAIAQAVKSFGEEGKNLIDPLERIKDCEIKIAECQKVIKEQTEKMQEVKKDLDDILILDDEKEITIEDEEINLDEMEIGK